MSGQVALALHRVFWLRRRNRPSLRARTEELRGAPLWLASATTCARR